MSVWRKPPRLPYRDASGLLPRGFRSADEAASKLAIRQTGRLRYEGAATARQRELDAPVIGIE